MARNYRQFVAHPVRDAFFPHAIGRLEFLGRYIAIIVFLIMVLHIGVRGMQLLGVIPRMADEIPPAVLIFAIPLWGVGITATLFSAVIPRARDAGMPAKSAFLYFIPFVSQIYFLLLVSMPRRWYMKDR